MSTEHDALADLSAAGQKKLTRHQRAAQEDPEELERLRAYQREWKRKKRAQPGAWQEELQRHRTWFKRRYHEDPEFRARIQAQQRVRDRRYHQRKKQAVQN